MHKHVVSFVFFTGLLLSMAAGAQTSSTPAPMPAGEKSAMKSGDMGTGMKTIQAPKGPLKLEYGDKKAEWTVASLAALPHKQITVTDEHSKANVTYSGVPLMDLLIRLGVPEKTHGAGLRTYLVVEGADGYRVVYSLAEVNPAIREAPVLLADTLDGKPLAFTFQLVAQADKGQSRWVRGVAAIDVMVAQ